MEPADFLEAAKDPDAWCGKALSLRRSADVVWDDFSRRLLDSIDKKARSLDDERFPQAENVLRNCQLLYSLSAECALKGLLVKRNPGNVAVTVTFDGYGNIVEGELKQIGGVSSSTHDLVKLAEASGVLQSGEKPEIRELLAFGTDCIQWFGRYPVPLKAKSDLAPVGKLPPAAFGHYFRDFMDPVLDEIIGQLEH